MLLFERLTRIVIGVAAGLSAFACFTAGLWFGGAVCAGVCAFLLSRPAR